jgi:hypothetical protein
MKFEETRQLVLALAQVTHESEEQIAGTSLDPYGQRDLLPRTTHGLTTKSRACVDDSKHDILHHLFIRHLRLSPRCLSVDYLMIICHISSQTTILHSQISLILSQQTAFVPYTQYVKIALLDPLDLTH